MDADHVVRAPVVGVFAPRGQRYVLRAAGIVQPQHLHAVRFQPSFHGGGHGAVHRPFADAGVRFPGVVMPCPASIFVIVTILL